MRKSNTAPSPIPTLRGYNPAAFAGTPADMSNWYYDDEEEDPNAPNPAASPVPVNGGVPAPYNGPGYISVTPTAPAPPTDATLVADQYQQYQSNPSYGYKNPGAYPNLALEDPTHALTASPGGRPQLFPVGPYSRNYGQESTRNARQMAIGTILAGALGGTDAALAVGGGLNQGFQQGANAVDAERARRYQLAKEAQQQDYFNQNQAYQDSADAAKAQQAAVLARNQIAQIQHGAQVGGYNANADQLAREAAQANINRGAVGAAIENADAAQYRKDTFGLAQNADRRAVVAQQLGILEQSPGFLTAAGEAGANQGPLIGGLNQITKGSGLLNQFDPNAPVPKTLAQQRLLSEIGYTNSLNSQVIPNAESNRSRQTAETTEGVARTKLEQDRLAEEKRRNDLVYGAAIAKIAAKGEDDINSSVGIDNAIIKRNTQMGKMEVNENQARKAGNLESANAIHNDITMLRDEVTALRERKKGMSIPTTNGVPVPISTEGNVGNGTMFNPPIVGTPGRPNPTPIGMLQPIMLNPANAQKGSLFPKTPKPLGKPAGRPYKATIVP